ncbi:MAG TPA: hemolysin III family protein [Myxococcota bacterium]
MSTADIAAAPEALVKPRLRGVLHQGAAVVAVGIGVFLAVVAPNERAKLAGLGFAASLFTLFTVSATYHRVHWQTAAARAWMRRADHASIFILIAGTYTPVALVGLPEDLGNRLLLIVWAGALLGVLQSLFWIHAPKFVAALIAVALGWSITIYWTEARAALTDVEMLLLFLGGVFYTAGALFYALKRPVLWPKTFGYHELFHAFTLIAAAFHTVGVHSIIMRSGS